MKEREFQAWVIETACMFGWKVWHVPMPMRPIGGNRFVPDSRGAGLPDLIMFHPDPPRLILAEVKGEGGTLSEEQREFLRLARGVRDGLDQHFAAVREAFERFLEHPFPGEWTNPVGVYTWRPGLEDLIEATLRSKTMVG